MDRNALVLVQSKGPLAWYMDSQRASQTSEPTSKLLTDRPLVGRSWADLDVGLPEPFVVRPVLCEYLSLVDRVRTNAELERTSGGDTRAM